MLSTIYRFRAWWLVALAMAALGSGCRTTYKVALEYYPVGEARPPRGGPEIWLAQPADVRGMTGEIGQERSAAGKREAAVKAKQPAINWVGNALLLELEHAGYTVKRCQRSLARGWDQPEIMLAIPGLQKLYADTTVPARNLVFATTVGIFSGKSAREVVANIDLSLDVYYGNRRYRKVYQAVHSANRGRESNPADIYKACYEAAMAEIARQVVADMDALAAGVGAD